MMKSSSFARTAIAVAVAAGTLAQLATAAEAGRRDRGGGLHGYSDSRHFDKFGPGRGDRRFADPRREYYGHPRKRRNNAGPAIALGAGLLMLGIIAAQSGRYDRYGDED